MREIAQNSWYKELPIPSYADWKEKSFLILFDITTGAGVPVTLQMMRDNQTDYALLSVIITTNTLIGSVGGRAILHLRRYL